MPLTDLQIRKLHPRAEGRYEVWDVTVPGFGVRISPAGRKTFVLLYRHGGCARRMTLGRYGPLTLSEARRLATVALGKLASGTDPQDGVRASRNRFDETVQAFVRTYCQQHNRASTRRETERILIARFVSKWKQRDLADIRKADVVKVLDEAVDQGAPIAANHALATVRVFFNWCVTRGLVNENPCTGLKMPAKPRTRARVLTDAELGRIWKAAGSIGGPFGAITQLLVLTAQRRNEIRSLRWGDVDFEGAQLAIPAHLTKNGVAHLVPLTQAALEVVRRVPRISDTMLFPSQGGKGQTVSGFSNFKRRLAELSAVPDFTLHDLRRTAATRLASFGVAPHVVERLLNHVTGTWVALLVSTTASSIKMRSAMRSRAGRSTCYESAKRLPHNFANRIVLAQTRSAKR